MSIAFKIGNEFLQLPQGFSIQLQQLNHLLNLSTEQIGEYSLPGTIPLNDVNARLLKFPLLPSTEKKY